MVGVIYGWLKRLASKLLRTVAPREVERASVVYVTTQRPVACPLSSGTSLRVSPPPCVAPIDMRASDADGGGGDDGEIPSVGRSPRAFPRNSCSGFPYSHSQYARKLLLQTAT